MGFKGTAYVGELKNKFGGFFSDNKQPQAFGGAKKTMSNMGESALTTKGSMMGKKWKSTCKGCGGKM